MFMSPSATTAGSGIVFTSDALTFSFAIDGDSIIKGFTLHIEKQNPPIMTVNDMRALKASNGLKAFDVKYDDITTGRTGDIVTLNVPIKIANSTTFQLGYYTGETFTNATWSEKKSATINFALSGFKYFISATSKDRKGNLGNKYYLFSPTGTYNKYGYDLPLTCSLTTEISEEGTITLSGTLNFTATFDLNALSLVGNPNYKGNYWYTIQNRGQFFNVAEDARTSNELNLLSRTEGQTAPGLSKNGTGGTSGSPVLIGDYSLFVINPNTNANNKTYSFSLQSNVVISSADTSHEDIVTQSFKGDFSLKDVNGNTIFQNVQLGSSLAAGDYRWCIDSILDSEGKDTGVVSKNEMFSVRPVHELDFTLGTNNNTITLSNGNLTEIRNIYIQNESASWKYKMGNTPIQIPYCGTSENEMACGKVEFKDGTKIFKEIGILTSFDKNIKASVANHLYATIECVKPGVNLKSFDNEDFGVILPSSATHDYTYFPNRKNNYANEVEDDDDFYGYSLLLATAAERGYEIQKAYDFELNVDISSYSNNKEYSVLKNFTSYPTVERSESDYLSGTCKSLIGKIGSQEDNYWQYVQRPEIIEELAADLVNSDYVKFLKMPEGRMLQIQPSGNLAIGYDKTHNFKEVSFNWTEIADATYWAIYDTKEEGVKAANGD